MKSNYAKQLKAVKQSGFERLVNALVKIFGEDKRKEIESKYRKLIYERSGK